MKKLVLIFVTLAILASLTLAVVAALPDTPGVNEMASNPGGAKQSHGTHGNGEVNQKFLNPIWGDDPCEPWTCPPGNDEP